MSTNHPHDLLAAFALDALPEGERARVLAHLAGCPHCRRWVAEHRGVTEVLALTAPTDVAPSPELRSRILQSAAHTEQDRPAAALVRSTRRLSRLTRLGGWLVAAVFFLTSVGLGVWNYVLRQELASVQQRPALQGALVATADARGALGRLDWLNGREPTLLVTVTNLPPPPAGLVYEAWVIDAQGPKPAGTFVTTPDGHGVVVLTRPATPGSVIAITVEPTPGTSAPTGKVLLKGTAEAGQGT